MACKSIMEKIHYCSIKLEEWGGGMIKEFKEKLKECRVKLRRLRSRRDDGGGIYWHPRAKQMWLQCGDQNTRFFHRFASSRKINNCIKGLQDKEGNWTENEDQIQNIVVEYFEELVASTPAEKRRVYAKGSQVLPGINRTLVCLIPKVKRPKRMAEFRPISLCDVLMRVVSKVMANRMKSFLKTLISDKQGAFVEGRLLTDNALLAFEINHCITRRSQGKRGLTELNPNTLSADREEICQSLQVQEVNEPGKYLGLPMKISRKKISVFQFLIDKVKQKLQGWGTKLVSRAGKATLIQTVAQTIPNFWMNQIPSEVCESIERQMNGYWWGHGIDRKWIRWKARERMCVRKEAGGLGFKCLRNFNLSMLAKQAWRLLNNDNPLVTVCMKTKYYPTGDFLNAKI
ncbi:uncharacterized protein LOC141713882 [Apium graveolens]|uniref:uncharacterized protein LOC141713882 n=1 Tax=Apium graveolens TaxID=4045 RepID=UPI003D79C29E